ncbi:MAG TPA: ABC transporter permease [Chloroflexota bacterium]|nr:ABC transporter permease [Chloroflexota bacterium]
MIRILRNLGRRKVRTALTTFGIAIGVFALTVMGAMSENFAQIIDGAEKLSSRTIQVSPASRNADDRMSRVTLSHLRQVDGVREVVTTLGGLLSDSDTGASLGPPEQVYGIDPAYIPDVFGSVPLAAGRWLDPGDNRATVVGFKVAANHNLGVGSLLTWRKNDYVVVGIMGETETFPDEFAIMPYDTVRRDLKLSETVIGGVSVVPDRGVNPEAVATRINREVPRVHAKSPAEFVAEIRQAMVIFNIITLGGAVLAAIVGGLAVINTMIMSVNERTREIGIKKALGAEDSTIVREYLTEAALIGLLGGVVGTWFGWVVVTILNDVLAASLGGSDVWLVTPRLVLYVLGFALALGLLAGVYPAWAAARLDPVQALRAE